MKFYLIVFLSFTLCSVSVMAQQKKVISQEEAKILEELENKKIDLTNVKTEKEFEQLLKNVSEDKGQEKKEEDKSKKIYRPASVVKDPNRDGYLLERDSLKIVTKKISEKDVLNIKVCERSPVSIVLDPDFTKTIQDADIDDTVNFQKAIYAEKRAVKIAMLRGVSNNQHRETSVKLIMNERDSHYLINVFGVPCPDKGAIQLPKIYILKDKNASILDNPKIPLMTPEDTIIAYSKGYPRLNKHGIKIYDMVTSAGAQNVVFGLEVHYNNDENNPIDRTKLDFIVLNNLQINKMVSSFKLLELQSKKAMEAWGHPVYRFNLNIKLDKDYIVDNRYIYLMMLDEGQKHYQYIEVDLLPYFLSLKERGFNL